jgi:hypothetical protein
MTEVININILGGSISDDEYGVFYSMFITPFVSCDTTKDNVLDAAELLVCFTTKPEFPFLNQLTPVDIAKLIYLFDQALTVNFFDYIFLRRINNAMNHCGENYLVSPSSLYCAL